MYRAKKRHIALLSAIALMVGLFATGVLADENGFEGDNGQGTLRNFMPENTFDDAIKTVMADQNDGQDDSAHFTAVAEPGTTQVEWWQCEPGEVTDEDSFDDNTGNPAICEALGSDTEGNQPEAAEDLAFEIFEPFAADDDSATEGVWDVVTRACEGTPNENPDNPAGVNCSVDIETNIWFDDASVGGAEFPTGEIVSLCAGSGTDCDQANEFDPTAHGDATQSGSHQVRFSTSDDVTAEPDVCIDDGGGDGPDAEKDPDSTTDCTGSTLLSDEGIFKIWESDDIVFPVGDFDLMIIERQGTGPEENDLVLDEHWHVAGAAEAGETVLHFPEEGDSDCDDPDQESFNDALGTDGEREEDLEGCLFNTFGALEGGGEVTFELDGVGEFSLCDGTTHDHDDDGLDEHCHVNDPDATPEAQIFNVDADGEPVTGDATVTFCRDTEAFGAEAGTIQNPSANHGCADEDEEDMDTALKHWIIVPDDIRLVFTGTGDDPTDAENECFTGDLFAENEVGDEDNLRACVFHDGDPVDTNQPGAGRLQWFIFPVTAGERTATEFHPTDCDPANPNAPTCPPRETRADGMALTTIDAIRIGNDEIEVCWQPGAQDPAEDEEEFDLCALVQKSVTREGTGDGDIPCTIGGTDGPETLTGTEGDDVICGFGGNDTLIGLGGNDVLLGGGGDDHHDGGPGDDTIEADQVNACLETGCADGNDTAQGGTGKDTINGYGGNDVLEGGDKNDFISGGSGDDILRGQNGWDTLRGNAGNDELIGARGNDILQGGRGSDLARGGVGDDTLRGFNGSDTLRGGSGDDIIKGGAGSDTLRGGRGADILDGGGGRDSCRGGRGNNVLRRCES